MLEKNKDYVEFTLRCTSVEYGKNKKDKDVRFNGYSDYDFPGVPMDVVCKEFGHKVVVVSKRDFEALQAENEQLKKKLEEFSQVPGYREFLTALYPEDDVERLVWATEQICCGQVSAIGWEESAKFWKKRYDDIFKLIGFSSKEEVEDYLVNEAECDTLHEAILKLINENKYACEEWCKANSNNNSWKAAAECNSPKELIAKLNLLRDDIKEWQKATGCKIPEAAKDLIESRASWHYAYNQVKEKDQKLTEEISDYKEQIKSLCKVIESWKEITGCSTPEEAKDWVAEIGEANGSLAKAVLSWQEITGFSTPEKCSSYIDTLEKKLEDIKDLIEED